MVELWTLVPIHTVAGVIWAGAQFYLGFVLYPWAKKNGQAANAALLKAGTPILHGLLALQFLTGFRLGMIHGGSPAEWFGFGERPATIAALKILLTLLLFALEIVKLKSLKQEQTVERAHFVAKIVALISIFLVLLGLNNRLGFLF